MWENVELIYLIENAGYVIAIHTVDQKCIVTVTRNGIITVWNINGKNWLRVDRVTVGSSEIVSIFSCLSYRRSFLTVLNENGDMVLYKLQKNTISVPACIKITEYFRKKYIHKLTCCEISQNEKYLAIGFENGDISVSLLNCLISYVSSVSLNIIVFLISRLLIHWYWKRYRNYVFTQLLLPRYIGLHL